MNHSMKNPTLKNIHTHSLTAHSWAKKTTTTKSFYFLLCIFAYCLSLYDVIHKFFFRCHEFLTFFFYFPPVLIAQLFTTNFFYIQFCLCLYFAWFDIQILFSVVLTFFFPFLDWRVEFFFSRFFFLLDTVSRFRRKIGQVYLWWIFFPICIRKELEKLWIFPLKLKIHRIWDVFQFM